MKSRFNDLDELWSEWPSAVSAVLRHLEKSEPAPSDGEWNFSEASVNSGGVVAMVHTAYSSAEKKHVFLSTQAEENEVGKWTARTAKRWSVEQSK